MSSTGGLALRRAACRLALPLASRLTRGAQLAAAAEEVAEQERRAREPKPLPMQNGTIVDEQRRERYAEMMTPTRLKGTHVAAMAFDEAEEKAKVDAREHAPPMLVLRCTTPRGNHVQYEIEEKRRKVHDRIAVVVESRRTLCAGAVVVGAARAEPSTLRLAP